MDRDHLDILIGLVESSPPDHPDRLRPIWELLEIQALMEALETLKEIVKETYA